MPRGYDEILTGPIAGTVCALNMIDGSGKRLVVASLIVSAVSMIALVLLAIWPGTASTLRISAGHLAGRTAALNMEAKLIYQYCETQVPSIPVDSHQQLQDFDIEFAHTVSRVRSDETTPTAALDLFDVLRRAHPAHSASILAAELIHLSAGIHFTDPANYPIVQRLLAACELGTQGDRNNAFFPVMHAMLLEHTAQTGSALSMLHAAALLPEWNDYVWAPSEAMWHTLVKLGGADVFTREALRHQVVVTHMAGIRYLCIAARNTAQKAEAIGDMAGGMRIRADLLAVGRLMRMQSRGIVGTDVGATIELSAVADIAGIPFAGMTKDRWRELSSTERLTANTNDFISRAAQANLPTLAEAARHEITVCQQTLHLRDLAVSAGTNELDRGAAILCLKRRFANTLWLGNAVWLGMLGIAASAVLFWRMNMRAAMGVILSVLATAAVITAVSSHWCSTLAAMIHTLGTVGETDVLEQTYDVRWMSAFGALIGPGVAIALSAGVWLTTRRRASALPTLCIVATTGMLVAVIGLVTTTRAVARQEASRNTVEDGICAHEGRYLAERVHLQFPQ